MKFQHLKISLATLVIVMASFMPTSFASAQAEDQITPADLTAAHASPAACGEFNKKLKTVTVNKFKAYWPGYIQRQLLPFGTSYTSDMTDRDPDGGVEVKCLIVPIYLEDFKSTTVNDENVRVGLASKQPISGKNVQTVLENGKVLDLDTILLASLRAEEEQSSSSAFGTALGWFISLIFSLISSFFALITAFAGKILVISIGLTTNWSTPTIVDAGWGILRDISNMFFILVMIVIGLAAILRIEKYDYRHLLVEVIIMAILVNFSKVIAVTIIDFSNFLVQLFAFDGFKDVFSFLWSVAWAGTNEYTSSGWTTAFIQGLTKIMFMVVTCGVFVILAGMFVIRLVGLYVLVILSPMAYILDILPDTKDLAHKWWHTFIHYVVWAPVAMFMLRLVMLIVQDGGLVVKVQSGNLAGLSGDSIFNYIIISALMIAAMLVAEHAGMVGGNAIVHGVEHAGHVLGHMAQGAAAQYWNKKTSKLMNVDSHGNPPGMGKRLAFMALNPVAATKGWMERSHEQQHMASEHAKATGREIADYIRTGGKFVTPHRDNLDRKEVEQYAKEYSAMDLEGRTEVAKTLLGVKSHEAQVRRRALLKAAAEENELEDLAIALRGQTGADGTTIKKYTKVGAAEIGDFLRTYSNASTDHESSRFIDQDIHNIGKKTKRFDYTHHKGHPDHHQTAEESERIRAEKASSELGKLDAQDRIRVSPQNFTEYVIEVDAKGNDIKDEHGNVKMTQAFTGDETQQMMVSKLGSDALSHINRAQMRSTPAFVGGEVVANLDMSLPQNQQYQKFEQGSLKMTQREYENLTKLWKHNKAAAQTFIARKYGITDVSKDAAKINGITAVIETKRSDGTVELVGREVGEARHTYEFNAGERSITKKP